MIKRTRLASSLLVFIALVSIARGNNLLLNPGFMDRAQSWGGSGQPSNAGLAVSLQPDGWSMVSQDFANADPKLTLEIQFKVSSDFSFKPTNSERTGSLFNSRIFRDLTGASCDRFEQAGERYSFFAVIFDSSTNALKCIPAYASPGTVPEDSSANFQPFTAARQTLYLFFPPGNGTITLTKVKVAPEPSDPSSPTNPPPSDPSRANRIIDNPAFKSE